MRKLTRENPLLLTPDRPAPAAVGIIGAGTIGPDIGYYLKSALPDLKLVMIDIAPEALTRAAARINAYADKGEKRGKLSSAQAAAVRRNVHTSTDYAALAGCDWVIEAATENIELKKTIFSQVEAVIDSGALITSNTSSIPAERLFSHLEHPERSTVTHFFAPAFKNPAVEVIDWQALDAGLLDYLRYTFCVTGKCPLVTDDKVCFMLDRIFDNWCNDAALLLEHATPAQIDAVAGEFVHAGPFFVLNLANGNPIIIETNSLQMEIEGEAYRPADVFETAGTWDTVRPGETVEVADELRQRIRDRLLGVLFSQTFDILDRHIGSPADLDLGARLAFAFKQGPLELARELGAGEVTRIMGEYAKARPGMPQPRQPIDSYQDFTRHVLEDRVDGCCVITLRRPEALNALHDDMTDEILAIVRRAEADPDVAGIVITGYGTTAFCAGADIDRFVPLLGKHGACVDYARACSRLLVHLDACSKPVVAALNGFALGGGLELAIRCDHIVATDSSWMQFPEITLGIAPGIGAMVVPYRRWPAAAATFHQMLLEAGRLSAAEAAGHGIVEQVVADAGELVPAAVALINAGKASRFPIQEGAIELAAAPAAAATAASGQTLSLEVGGIIAAAISNAAAADSFVAALDVGYHAFGDSAATAAAREGITAFGERRPPDFSATG